jgi:hypothetical protein
MVTKASVDNCTNDSFTRPCSTRLPNKTAKQGCQTRLLKVPCLRCVSVSIQAGDTAKNQYRRGQAGSWHRLFRWLILISDAGNSKRRSRRGMWWDSRVDGCRLDPTGINRSRSPVYLDEKSHSGISLCLASSH